MSGLILCSHFHRKNMSTATEELTCHLGSSIAYVGRLITVINVKACVSNLPTVLFLKWLKRCEVYTTR